MNMIFDVPDISCGHCKMRIEAELNGHPEVDECMVDIEKKEVRVRTSLPAEAVIGLIDKSGYDAVLREGSAG